MRWCARCGHEYRSVAEARKTVGCPKCHGMVMTNRRPTLTATRERRSRATTQEAERR